MVVLLTRQRVAGQLFKDRNLATAHGCCATGRRRGRHRGPEVWPLTGTPSGELTEAAARVVDELADKIRFGRGARTALRRILLLEWHTLSRDIGRQARERHGT